MKYLLASICLLSLFACNSPKEANTNNNVNTTNKAARSLIFTYEKGPCHGTCPTYLLSVYDDGFATYEGKRFSDRQGKHTKVLSERQAQSLIATHKNTDFDQFPSVYESRIPDFSLNTLTCYKNGAKKACAWRESADDALLALGKQLAAIADNKEGWTMEESQALPEHFIANELIVYLINPDLEAATWCEQYKSYNLKVKERLMPNQNYWLLTYDPSKVAPYKILNVLNADENVHTAEFNKKVEIRNNRSNKRQ